MSADRNSGPDQSDERWERRARARLARRQQHWRQREAKIAWARACHQHRWQHGDHETRKEWFGIFIILIGLVWLANELWHPFPDWLFSWQALLIAIGCAIGMGSRFRNKVSFILILIGGIFLCRDYLFPEIDLAPFIWPLIFIVAGCLFLMRRQEEARLREYMRSHPEAFRDDWRRQWHHGYVPPGDGPSSPTADPSENKEATDATNPPPEGSFSHGHPFEFADTAQSSSLKDAPGTDDWLDVSTICSGTRRTIISKAFTGGKIVNILGGTEIDLSRADIKGTVRVEVTNIMGGVRLAVPSNWGVNINCTTLMGGTEDARRHAVRRDPDKTLLLTGTVFMAGVEITDIL